MHDPELSQPTLTPVANLKSRAAEAFELSTRVLGSAQAQRVFRASGWTILGYGFSTLLRAISRIVLAKLLLNAAPLGNAAVVTTIVMGVEMVSDLGIGNKIIQHGGGADPAFLRTAYSVQILRTSVLWAITTAAAWPIAWFYKDLSLASLLVFGAIGILIRGCANPALWTLSRQVRLRAPIVLGLVCEVVGFVVTMGWMLIQPSAWPLVGGTVATAAAYTLGSHLVVRPTGLGWDRKAAREILTFGGWTILSTGTWFLCTRGEALMLKGRMPDIVFGCLSFATLLVQTPISAINQLGAQVYFPMMAAWMRDDRAAAQRQFVRARWAFTALAVGVSWGGILLGPRLVNLFHFNKSYDSLAWMVEILSLRAAQDVYGTPATNLLLAAGELKYSSFSNTVRLVVLVGGLAFAVPLWGVNGALWVLVAAPYVSYYSLMSGVRRHMRGAIWLEVQTMSVFVVATAAAAVVA